MFKVLIFLFVFLCAGISYANDEYRIIVKIDDEVISNHDIKKEKNYLTALNPTILNLSEDEVNKIAKQSIVREVIKKKEIFKYYNPDYETLEVLMPLAKNIYTRLNINSEEELRIYLATYDLKLKEVLIKIAVEKNWQTLIYEKFKHKINIDNDKIKKNLELESSIAKKEKLFLLSEIVFNPKNQKEFDENYQKILDTIKKKDFKSAATIYSLSDTAKFGGEIGWVGKKDISKKIYKQISTLRINEFTEPLKIGSGFLLLNLDNMKEEERKNNLKESYNNIITKETNRQLNQYSIIYFKKIKKKSFIYED